MPNLVTTFNCNNNCDFCFVDSENNEHELTMSVLKSMMPFIKSFRRNGVNLVGGEPTLAPNFYKILHYLLQHDLRVNIFTNGKIKPDLVEKLQHLHIGNYSFCVNRSSEAVDSRITHFYKKLGYRIQLSVTISSKSVMPVHITEEILKYRLNKTVRVGIALPMYPNRNNQYLKPEDYGETAENLFSFFEDCLKYNIRPSFDCGFPYCFFNAKQKAFFEAHHIEFASNCGIIPDIQPDGNVIPCFPLSKFTVDFTENSHWPDIRENLEHQLNSVGKRYLFDFCEECNDLREGRCCGGCSAFRFV